MERNDPGMAAIGAVGSFVFLLYLADGQITGMWSTIAGIVAALIGLGLFVRTKHTMNLGTIGKLAIAVGAIGYGLSNFNVNFLNAWVFPLLLGGLLVTFGGPVLAKFGLKV